MNKIKSLEELERLQERYNLLDKQIQEIADLHFDRGMLDSSFNFIHKEDKIKWDSIHKHQDSLIEEQKEINDIVYAKYGLGLSDVLTLPKLIKLFCRLQK